MIILLSDTVVEIGIGFVEFIVSFMSATIPTYFVAVSLLGQASATGFYNVLIVSIGLIQYLFLKVFIPLIKTYLVLGLDGLSKKELSSSLGEL